MFANGILFLCTQWNVCFNKHILFYFCLNTCGLEDTISTIGCRIEMSGADNNNDESQSISILVPMYHN